MGERTLEVPRHHRPYDADERPISHELGPTPERREGELELEVDHDAEGELREDEQLAGRVCMRHYRRM